jgi:hypothetical protein
MNIPFLMYEEKFSESPIDGILSTKYLKIKII